MKLSSVRLLLTITIVALGSSARAHERDGVWTYEWYVPYALEREVEFWWTDFGEGRSNIQIEYEFGVDGHYAIAPYLLIERDGEHFRTVGWKLEQRYSFGEFGTERLLPSLNLELKKEGDEPYEVEAKAIGTYVFDSGISASANLIAERAMESGAPVEWGYAAMVSKSLGRHSYAIEAFGNWTSGSSFIGPTIGTSLAPGEKVVAGYAFSTNGDPGRLRLLFEKEF